LIQRLQPIIPNKKAVNRRPFYLDVHTYGRLYECNASARVYHPVTHFNIVAVTDAGTFTLSHCGVLTIIQSHNDVPCSASAIALATGLPAGHTGSHGGTDHNTRLAAATGSHPPYVLHHAATLATTVPMTIPLVDRVVWPVRAARQGDTYGGREGKRTPGC
jgi:hypothetical protein